MVKQENVDSEVDEEKSALLANQELSDEARGRICKPITKGPERPTIISSPFLSVVWSLGIS